MVEIELKFQVPAERRAAVRQAVATSGARTTHLRARYFDTPDRRLARAGFALRLRQEDHVWVQTLKGRGDGRLARLEHEVSLGPQPDVPTLDIQLHAQIPVGQALLDALGKHVGALQAVFEVDVLRTHRIVRSLGSRIELALDVGEIRAGAGRLEVHELEFELKSGTLAGLLDLASRWVGRHGLWLDVRTKSERGDRLARGQICGPVVQARTPSLTADMGLDAALRAITGVCMEQILPNVAELASGDGSAEHLHQARVGMRRLRSALRLFGDPEGPAWEPQLAALAKRLGAARDRDLMDTSLRPALLAAGAPLGELPVAEQASDPALALRRTSCTQLLLALLQFAHGAEANQPADEGAALQTSIGVVARAGIKGLHRQLRKDAAAFDDMDDAKRHRVRKRLKRLRYGVEFVSSLYRGKAVKRYLACLRPAQEALGLYNDLCVAEAAFRQQAQTDPRAWFAVGWLSAQREPLREAAARALREAMATKPPTSSRR
ncbi:CYTH and CHAD domain-containing protein [Roseateles toxinivorans]|uniref:Inorganic triphosphatase YgiF n=1 Tax=Roseateles toxinivorans TaxID=270368 RepID=A0A4V3CT02_9BURK|nr:CYTH and CHAD domain-containing protein [Roseateles toxinivorans]TDP63038.1 inorganic triphosphatase YgiF [Roseateles toxinivorans]